MGYDPDIHNRHSIRLKEYDYSFAGAYFVTICVHGRESLFGDVTEGEMRLTDGGWIVERGWSALPERFPNVELDVWIAPARKGGRRFGCGFGTVNVSQMRKLHLCWPPERIFQTSSEKSVLLEEDEKSALEKGKTGSDLQGTAAPSSGLRPPSPSGRRY